MGALVKVQHKGQVTIPTRLRARAGIREGDLVEASYHRGKIVLTPTLVIERSQLPSAGDEYTPEQRRAIARELAKGLEDVRKGRVYGPFTGKGAARFLQAELRTRAKARKRSR